MRLIQFQGSFSGRAKWLAPVIVLLAAIGGIVVLLVTVLLGTVALAVGSVLHLVKGGSGKAAIPGARRPASFLGGLTRKLFGSARTSRPAQTGSEPQTISLDRGEDGVWRP